MTILVATSFFISMILGWIYLRFPPSTDLIVIPNKRSAHLTPTIEGGGLVIILTFGIFLFFGNLFGFLDSGIYLSLFFCASLVGIVGFIDDVSEVNPLLRLTSHFVAALLGLYILEFNFHEIILFNKTINLGFIGSLLVLVYIVWILNLYNFMDGIDGIASIQVISVCLSFGLICFFRLSEIEIWKMHVLLAGACSGFLFWNFPIARMFLGDTGSGFLGIILAFFSLEASLHEPVLFWSFLILMGVFIVDATFTLIIRLLNFEVLYHGHSNHAYQHAARAVGSHAKISLLVLSINLFWLSPLAFATAFGQIQGIVGLLIAFIPLLCICIYFKLNPSH